MALNICTGAPLAALWVGSQVQESASPTMSAVAVVVGVLTILVLLLVTILGMLRDRYAQSLGGGRPVRQHLPWLRSMRGERHGLTQSGVDQTRLSAPDRIIVGVVALTVVAFEVWFLLAAGSPFGEAGKLY